ncbi:MULTISPECIES: cobalt ECF transporter T component CbiQ [Salinibaculum]|uniref:cobalt ECF transporter T component CbiQ n=1 Tax=Salinibaculum TaxID=2732368 RepID=UPI0030D1435D
MILHVAATVTELLRSFFVTEETAARDGLLQTLQPRATLVGVAVLLVGVVVSRDPLAVLALAAVPPALAVASSVRLRRLFARTALVPVFSLVVVAPQAVLVPGDPLFAVAGFTVTVPGVVEVATFAVRVWTGVALLALVVLTTPFSEVVAALRRLRVPTALVWLLAVSYRYLFLFFTELQRLLRARESRTIARRGLRARWRDLAQLSGTFLIRTLERGERVHRGMRARGGASPPSPYDRGGDPGLADALFVAGAVAVAVAAGVVRWLP